MPSQRSDSCFYATYRAFINCFSSSSKTWSPCAHWRSQSQRSGEAAHGEHRAQTYNGGLGQSPQRGLRAEPLVWGPGGEAPLNLNAFCMITTRGVGHFVLKSILAEQKYSSNVWPDPPWIGQCVRSKEISLALASDIAKELMARTCILSIL